MALRSKKNQPNMDAKSMKNLQKQSYNRPKIDKIRVKSSLGDPPGRPGDPKTEIDGKGSSWSRSFGVDFGGFWAPGAINSGKRRPKRRKLGEILETPFWHVLPVAKVAESGGLDIAKV